MLTHYKNDDLVINVPVTFEPGSGVTNLTGATYEVEATDGIHTVTGVGATNGDNQSLTVIFPEDVFRAGIYNLSVRVTIGTVTQTVATEVINVNP